MLVNFFNWSGWANQLFWDAGSSLVLAITAIFICWQAWESRKSGKYLEHSIKPIVWFILRSARTLIARGYAENNISNYDSQLIVINGSNFPILFYFKISWEKDGVKLRVDEGYWTNNPLHIYPDRMSYPPALLNLGGIAKGLRINENSTHEIYATIEYRFAARHSPDKEFRGLPETWRFNLLKEVWVGPNGIEDNNIFLPKEGLVQKVGI